ncbi:unnamed protein product [Calicophoron daubneyi]|uniref:Tr-type G domain-containing protein n=1 Tax=Calicophoron daubneyi TaxID=300641 RepID=A0AAV2TXW1_CALDB
MMSEPGEEALFSLTDKLAFVKPSERQFSLLEKYFIKQLEDGQGECFLELGIGDGQPPGLSESDLQASVETIQRLAKELNLNLVHLRDRCAGATSSNLSAPNNLACKNKQTTPDGKSQAADQMVYSKSGPYPTSESVTKNGDTATSSETKSSKKWQKNRTKNASQSSPQTVSNSTSPVGFSLSPTQPDDPVISNGYVVREYLLRKEVPSDDFVDVRVAVVGNVDAGKSTLLGVLTHGELDNGRGLARLRLLRHKHEAETGRTSSVSNDILGFNSSGQVVNKPTHGQLDWSTICKSASKVVTFIDLAGHERYLKTTIFGMTGHSPDYAMFMVGANAGVIGMAKEHLGLALALNIPVFVVVTKIDMCPPNVLQETMSLLFRILKSPGCRKIPILISSTDDVICSATNFSSERMCPVFSVSNVTGENLDLLKMFLNLLIPRSQPRLSEPAHFQVDEIFSVPGVGNVVSGTCLSGIIRLNDTLLLGPDPMGQFNLVPIRGIHRKRMPVTYVRGGQTASFALKKLKRSQLRKGIVLVSPELHPRACVEFTAEVLILHHPTTISVGYQAMVHAGPIRQTATILAFDRLEHLRTGDKDVVRFRFIRYPEYLYSGLRLIFREGKTKAVGTVKETFPINELIQPVIRNRLLRKFQRDQQPSGAVTTSSTSAQSDAKSAVPVSSGTESASVVITNLSSAPSASDSVADSLNKPAYSKQRKHFRRRKENPTKGATSAESTQPSNPGPSSHISPTS